MINKSILAPPVRITIVIALAAVCSAASLHAVSATVAPSAHASNIPAPTDKEIIDTPLYKRAPEYPERAMLADVEGSVRIAVTIAPDGHVAKAEVIEAVPEGWFEEAALASVKSWKYGPPRREVTFQVSIDFTLP